jgi:hypothetical protein
MRALQILARNDSGMRIGYSPSQPVIAGLDPAIHVFAARASALRRKAWMTGSTLR